MLAAAASITAMICSARRMPQTDQVHPDQAFFLPQAVLIAAQVARRQARRAVPGKAHRIEKGAGQRDCQGGGSKILDPVKIGRAHV